MCVAVLYVGGYWNNGTNGGLWYWNGNNDASNAHSDLGGRILILKRSMEHTQSLPLGKKHFDKRAA